MRAVTPFNRQDDDHALDAARRTPVRAYMCCKCQKEQREEWEPDLYRDHVMRQSRHGGYERPPLAREVFDRLVRGA